MKKNSSVLKMLFAHDFEDNLCSNKKQFVSIQSMLLIGMTKYTKHDQSFFWLAGLNITIFPMIKSSST